MSTLTKAETGRPREIAHGRLDFLWLEVTQKCNLTCTHCYVSSSPEIALHGKMRHEDWLAAIEEAASVGCKAIQFIGGEPLLYPRIDDLVTRCRELDFSLIEIFTNGTPVNDRKAALFSKLGVQVACSFYSAQSQIHDTITGKIGSFERTMAGLRQLRSHSVPVRIGFIEMAQNGGHFEEARNLLQSIGISTVRYDSIRGFGRGEELALAPSNSSKFEGLCGQCCRSRLCLTYSGEIFPCTMSRAFPVGDFFAGGLTATLEGDQLGEFQREMKSEFFGLTSCLPQEGGCNPETCGPTSCEPDPHCQPDQPACGPIPDCAPDIHGMALCNPQGVTPCSPGPVPCMVCGPGNCTPDMHCDPDGGPCLPSCIPDICMPG